MFDLRKAPVAKVLIPFAGGAVAGYEIVVPVGVLVVLLTSLLIWLILVSLFLQHRGRRRLINLAFASLSLIFFFTAGYGTGMITRPTDPGLPVGDHVMIRGEVLEEAYPGKRNWIMEMRLITLVSGSNSYHTRTCLKVYMEMPADSMLPAAGETWQLYGQLSAIRNNGNPGELDYEAIMHRKDCWYRFFVSSRYTGVRQVENQLENSIRAASIRKTISDNWSGDREAVSLLKAVCLGDRSGLTNDMRQSYSAAGGMHLLAVSGLHVGLIWWVLQHSLSWMVRLFRKEHYRAITIITLLWFYAYVTGFSSSVSRSVTMFTFFTLARMMDRRTHPVNGILVSAFVLILINPGKLLDVGFQLSYAAILGIVTLFPNLRSLLKVKNRFLKWIWEATIVSLSAQLSTAPLVVYYFHQLPAYALLTNLFAIPLLSGLIALFVFSFPFMATGFLAELFNEILVRMGSVMNRSMEFVASIPGAVIGELSLDQMSLYMFMAVIFMGMLMLNYRSNFPRYGMLFLVSAMLGWTSWSRYNRLHSSEMVVSHFNGCSLVTFREGLQVDHYSWHRDGSTNRYMDQFKWMNWDSRRYESRSIETGNSVHMEGVISTCRLVAPGLWIVGNDRIKGWVITDLPGKNNLDFLADKPGSFILLSCEPKIRETFVNERAASCDLIVDGSNREWYIRQLERKEETIHFTDYQGAYLKRW
ncbi:MAG: ComEC/Rec2 family competence protein [Bacteroidota bacterium]